MPANVTTSDIITQEAIRRTVEEAIEENLVYGRAFRTMDISGIDNDTIKIPKDDDNMAQPEKVGENASFPRDEEDMSTLSATVERYGLEVAVSDMAVADSVFDIVQFNVEKKARRMAEKLNDLAHTELNANLHTNSPASDSTDGTLGFDDIVKGRQELVDDGYNPQWLIVGPQGENDLLNSNEFQRATDLGDDTVLEASIGRVAGFDVILDDSGNLGSSSSDAFLVDPSNYGFRVEKGGVQTDEYDDPKTRSRAFQIWWRGTFKSIDSNGAIKINGDA